MSKVLVTESYLTDIGNAIRSKNESTTKYKPSEMAAAIKAITTGNVVTQLDSVTLTNQYIDTGITPEPGYTYEFKLKTADTTSDWYALFGTRLSDGDSRCFGIVQVPGTAGQVRFDFDYTDTSTSSSQVNFGALLSGGATISFTGNGTSLTVAPTSGSSQSFTKKAISSSSTTGLTASVYLGAYHREDTGAAIFENPRITFYSVKITNGSTVVADFTPASYNGVNGMYESVNNKFHGVDGKITDTTANGTATNVWDSLVHNGSTTDITDTDTGTFTGLINITSFTSNCEKIGNSAFSDASSLESVSLPNCTTIGDNSFYNNNSLTTVDNPKCTTIGNNSFYSCDKLKEIKLSNVTSIGPYAFNLCYGLTSIALPKIQTIDNSFMSCSNITSVTIGPNIKSISSSAFYNCTKLTTITINRSKDAISGSPWGATNATVSWTGTT